MNARERYLAIMNFQGVDRLPNWELGVWGQTYERWLKEGAKEEEIKGDWFRGEPKIAKLDRRGFIPLKLGPIPGFYQLIEQAERYKIFIDEWGRKRRSLSEGVIRGTTLSMDTYLDFFVKKREDFLEMKKHFNPDEPMRYPPDWEELKKKMGGKRLSFISDGELWVWGVILESTAVNGYSEFILCFL